MVVLNTIIGFKKYKLYTQNSLPGFHGIQILRGIYWRRVFNIDWAFNGAFTLSLKIYFYLLLFICYFDNYSEKRHIICIFGTCFDICESIF